jgi:hypothetical protein
MGDIHEPAPVLLIMAAFSRYDAALDWAAATATAAWGPIALESPRFAFGETDYYGPTMGGDLKKTFFAFQRLVDTGTLPELKRTSNRWEAEYAALARHPESRPLNLDPGYIMPGKLVLASTKDHSHRLYVGQGIFAEVTLYFKDRAWQVRDWTFPDYRRADYQAFFSQCRDYLRQVSHR